MEKLVEVNYLTSRVLLISDIKFKNTSSLENQVMFKQSCLEREKKLDYCNILKTDYFKNTNKDLLVFTSGAGGIFKSGIPIGVIKKENIPQDKEKMLTFIRIFLN